MGVGRWALGVERTTLAAGSAAFGHVAHGQLAIDVCAGRVLSEPFELGNRGTCTAPQEGDLYLRCRDRWSQIGDNDEAISVYLRKSATP